MHTHPPTNPKTERSARSTFPDLVNFRKSTLVGWRRVFAHTADVFWRRSIARPGTGEIASLSCEPVVVDEDGGKEAASAGLVVSQ
jgi:hypothetical protein